MAGNYPNVPSWRMAWDVDGTQLFGRDNGGSPYSISAGDKTDLNSETPDAGYPGNLFVKRTLILIFPEARDLDGYYLQGHSSGAGGPTSGPLEVSTNSTNGIDGTWTQLKGVSSDGGAFSYTGIEKTFARTAIEANTVLGIKALRFSAYGGNSRNVFGLIHLYGEPAPGVNLQRLEIWHPTLDQRLGEADLDWGDVPRNSSATRTFRIKNMHPTLTANSVRAAMSILTDTAPSVVGQAALSKDGGLTWAAQQTLSSPLGPGAISSVLQIRRTTPANATLSVWWHRLFADCTSWT